MANKIELPSVLDLNSLQSDDFKQAQSRFQNAINSGYDEQTAAAIYLTPIQAKWQIIQSHPNEFQDKSKLEKINSDFTDAASSALRNLNKSDYTSYIDKAELDPSKRIKQSAADAIMSKFAPAISTWQNVGVKPTMSAAQQLQLKNIQSEINREESQLNRYESAAEYAQGNANTALQQTMEAAADKQRQKVAQMRSAADALTLGLSRPTGGQRLDQVDSGASGGIPASAMNRPIPGIAESLYGTAPSESGIQLPAPEPFSIPQAPAPAALALTKKPVIFISGRPDLSNVTREEADASWLAAHPNAMNRSAAAVLSTPSDVESEQPVNEVERVTKDGRRAIFDSRTRKFIRYAD